MISYWGYRSEMHEVITADGYVLQVYRIPHGKNDANHLGRIGMREKNECLKSGIIYIPVKNILIVKH